MRSSWSYRQSAKTGGRAGFLIFPVSWTRKGVRWIDYLTKSVPPLKLGTLWKFIGMICVTVCWLKSLGWVITKVGPVTKLERDIILYKSPPHTLAIIITVFSLPQHWAQKWDLKDGIWKKLPQKRLPSSNGKATNSLQVSTKHSCNHHHNQHLLPPLITGRLAVVYSYGSEVGTFWRLSTLCCFYAWKAVWSLNRLPCCPVSPNLINHDIRLQSVYACIDRAFRFYFWGAGSRRKNPQSWISLSSSGRTMNGHNYSFFCSVKSK